MNIICAGMSRSGSTLQYQLISTFVENHGGVACGNYHPDKKYPIDKICVFKSERFMPFDVAFSIIRNPLDVAISLYRYRIGKEYYYPMGTAISLIGLINSELKDVLSWIEAWEKAGAHLLRYEDLYPDGFGDIIRQASNVLEIETTGMEISEIVSEYTLERNAARIELQDRWFDFTASMLTKAHIGPQSGKPGCGEMFLNDKHKQAVLSFAGDFMERHGYL